MRSVKDQIAWCGRAQWAMTGLMFALVAAFVVLAWWPLWARQRQLKGQIESATRQLQVDQARAMNLPLLAGEVAKMEAKLQRFNKRLPRTADLGEFVRELTRVSQDCRLRKLVHQPGQPRRLELYNEVPITMNFEGDFGTVFTFIRQMEEMQRLVRVRNLNIRCRDAKLGQVDVSMALNIYYSDL